MGYTTLIPPALEEQRESANIDPFLDDQRSSLMTGQSAELDNAMHTLTPHAAIAKLLEESRWLLEALEQGQVSELREDYAEPPPSPHQQNAPPSFVL